MNAILKTSEPSIPLDRVISRLTTAHAYTEIEQLDAKAGVDYLLAQRSEKVPGPDVFAYVVLRNVEEFDLMMRGARPIHFLAHDDIRKVESKERHRAKFTKHVVYHIPENSARVPLIHPLMRAIYAYDDDKIVLTAKRSDIIATDLRYATMEGQELPYYALSPASIYAVLSPPKYLFFVKDLLVKIAREPIEMALRKPLMALGEFEIEEQLADTLKDVDKQAMSFLSWLLYINTLPKPEVQT